MNQALVFGGRWPWSRLYRCDVTLNDNADGAVTLIAGGRVVVDLDAVGAGAEFSIELTEPVPVGYVGFRRWWFTSRHWPRIRRLRAAATFRHTHNRPGRVDATNGYRRPT